MKLFKKISYLTILKYFCVFSVFLTVNSISATPLPLSIAVLSAFLYLDFSMISTPLLFIGAGFVSGSSIFTSLIIGGTFIVLVYGIYRATKSKPKGETLIYTLVALIPYFLTSPNEIYFKITVSVINCVLTFCFIPALRCVLFKSLKYKPDFNEVFCLSLVTVCLSLGLSNLVGVEVWKLVSVILILITTYVYRLGISVLLASVLSLSVCIYYSDLSFIGIFTLWALSALSVMKVSRFLSALVIPLIDFAVIKFFNVMPYGIKDILFVTAGSVAFCLIPTTLLCEVKERLHSFRERQLVRQTVNRNRYVLSNRLYELSGVFLEIANVLSSFKKENINDGAIKKHLFEEITTNICTNCDNKPKCKAKKVPSPIALDKLLSIGLAKGKVSFIDVPSEISSHCIHTNDMIFCVNKLLAEYRNYMIDSINYDKSKQLIAGQASGIAEVLKGLAFETGQTLKYRNNVEKNVSTYLKRTGVNVSEILIYGDGNEVSVSMMICSKELPVTKIVKATSDAVGIDMQIAEQAVIQDDKIFVLLKKQNRFDAVFGVASISKDGSEKCGDTHSVERLGTDKFMVALSDGMGSGKYAESISDASLSLIESFYKAGMESALIMNTVNKLLAINTEDSFAALDICVFDLNTLTADFIKFGAPYGFIITVDGIKIIEGSSLPLGILDDLKPSVTTDQLSAGDMLLFVTDGVSDSFGSSSAIIDFLQRQPAKNPQTLAESVLSEAVTLAGGKHADDMTCVALRVFERKTA